MVRDGAVGVWPDTAYREHRVDSIDEAALFGEIAWRLSANASMATGVRVFRSNLATHATTVEPIVNATAASSEHLVDVGVAPDIRLSYQASTNALFYLSAAEGYRSGGFNTGGPIGLSFGALQPHARYAGDHIWTFEAGGRFDFADGRLRLQPVAFLNDWRDIQTDTLHANGFTYSGNVGDARSFGIELGARYLPTDHFSINADILFNEPELTGVSASFPDAAHGALPGSPEYSASASIRYEDALSLGDGSTPWFAQIDTRYVGDAKLGFGEGPRVGGYITIDARIVVSFAAWSAMLYVDNLTDSDGPTFSVGNPYQPTLQMETPLRPLTIGFSLERAF
jgi:outer membrane receptor protein involved in Fe transport